MNVHKEGLFIKTELCSVWLPTPTPEEATTTFKGEYMSSRRQVTKYNLNTFLKSLSVMSWWIVRELSMRSSLLVGIAGGKAWNWC